jgi:hypothetical protein
MDEVGLAVTEDPLVADKSVEGLQVYVEAPLAVSVVDVPSHIVTLLLATTVGSGFTVTSTVVELIQPFASVPVIVYVVDVVGSAVTDEPVVPDNPVAGLQVYVEAPDAVNVVDEPIQIASSLATIVGSGAT